MSRTEPSVIVITGATGTGKTELAVEVAERIDGEIVSADSRQVYRTLEIGTAKPDRTLRGRVLHHGLDIIDPDEDYSAGQFARDARAWIAEIRDRGRVPLVVGGSGFFIRALLDPLPPEPDLDPDRRDRLREYLSGRSIPDLQRWLARHDPIRARQLEGEGGVQRRARSLEVVLLSGRPHSWWAQRPSRLEPLSAVVFCLQLPRSELYRRLERRFERMMDAGLLREVRSLLDRYPPDAPGLRAVGYRELIGHLQDERSLDEAVELAKRNTRRFARRQLTWFRHQLPEDAIRLDAPGDLTATANEIARVWKGMRSATSTGS